MKTNRIFVIALSLALAFSCQKENFSDNQKVREFESATIETGVETRTSLSGKDVLWTSDDVVAVFDNTNYKNTFNVTETTGSYAHFAGSVTEGTTQIYAVYPENLALSASGSSIKVNIPVNQTSKVGSFAEEHNISVAKAAKTPGIESIGDITFNNVCAYLKFTVPSYIKDVTSVTFTTSRAIAGEATVDASADAPVAVANADASKSVTMTGSYAAGSTFWFVLSPGAINGFTVTVTTAKAKWTIKESATVTFEAGKYKNLGTLTLEKVSAEATAEHTYSGGNTLTGTTVSVKVNIPGTINEYDPIVSMSISVKNSAGTVVRTTSKTSDFATATLEADDKWPYLPSGKYTVEGTCTLKSGAPKSFSASFTTVQPSNYTVNAPSPHTSYTKYLNNDIAGANSCKPLTVYNIRSASVNISSAILSNPNYTSINSGFAYRLGTSAVDADTSDATTLGVNKVTAIYTFDGYEAYNSAECYVTGLPYTLNVAGNDNVSPWSESGRVVWNESSSVQLGSNLQNLGNWLSGEAYITKSFSLPDNVNVLISSSGTAQGTGSLVKKNTTFTLSVSGSNAYSYTTTNGSEEQSYSVSDKSVTMTSASPVVKCNNSYCTSTACSRVKSLTIKYGNK